MKRGRGRRLERGGGRDDINRGARLNAIFFTHFVRYQAIDCILDVKGSIVSPWSWYESVD